MYSRIYLIGFMGSGKTTQGKAIARMMAYDFVDMDDWISEQLSMSIPEIFSQHGEAFFREQETLAISQLAKKEKVVIATGGGAPCKASNMKLLKESGLTVYFKLSPRALMSRLKKARTERPLLSGKSDEEMLITIEEMLKDREPYYEQAHMIIDGLEGVTERLVNAIQRRSE